jgi:hypothetical protein
MKKLLILAAAAGALALPGLANAADATGTWAVAISIADMTFHTNCAFKQDGATLSGTCTPADAPPGGDPPKPAVITGSVDGQTVKWGYDVSIGDMMFHVDFTGALSSDTAMKGKFEVSGMDGDFTATKS